MRARLTIMNEKAAYLALLGYEPSKFIYGNEPRILGRGTKALRWRGSKGWCISSKSIASNYIPCNWDDIHDKLWADLTHELIAEFLETSG